MSFTPAIPSLGMPMGASPKPTLVLDLEGVAGKEVKLHEWLDASNGSYYDCVVDWGDGTVEKLDEGNFQTVSHTYSENAGVSSQPDGSVSVRIAGKFDYITTHDNLDSSGLRPYLFFVDVENTSPLLDFYRPLPYFPKIESVGDRIFENAWRLTTPGANVLFAYSSISSIPSGLFDALVNVTSFGYCFNTCRNLADVPEKLFDNLQKIRDFQFCFAECNNSASATLNLWKTTSYSNALPQSNNLKTVHIVNLHSNATIAACIRLLYDRSALDEKGTLIIRKNIPEALDTLTDEQEAALNARGWVLGTE